MNNKQKPFIGIPLTNEKYLLSINKINKKKKDSENIFNIICNILFEDF